MGVRSCGVWLGVVVVFGGVWWFLVVVGFVGFVGFGLVCGVVR